MKRLILAAALCVAGCAPALTAISTVSDIIARPVATVAGEKITIEATRGLIIAHNAYQGAAAALTPMVRAGVFTDAQLAKIQALNDRAKALLDGADTTLTAAQRTAGILSIVDELNRIAGR